MKENKEISVQQSMLIKVQGDSKPTIELVTSQIRKDVEQPIGVCLPNCQPSCSPNILRPPFPLPCSPDFTLPRPKPPGRPN